MAETVNYLIVKVTIEGQVTGTDGTVMTVDETYEKHFSDGTGTNNVGQVWQDQSRSLNTTSEDLQLDGLTDFQGDTTSSLNNVKLLYIRNLDTDAGDTFVVGGSTNGNEWDSGPFTSAGDQVTIQPGGILLVVDPTGAYTITAGDDLNVTAADNSTYRAILAGDNSA